MTHTLRDEAAANEGAPLSKPYRVELLDRNGNVVEYQDVTADTDGRALAEWAGNYVLCMAAEGMDGSVQWHAA